MKLINQRSSLDLNPQITPGQIIVQSEVNFNLKLTELSNDYSSWSQNKKMARSHSRQSPNHQVNRFALRRRQTRQWQFNHAPFAATRQRASIMARLRATGARASSDARYDASTVIRVASAVSARSTKRRATHVAFVAYASASRRA